MNRNDKEKLLQYIQEVSFAVLDSNLYLDTHPYDKEALAYFEKYSELRKDAIKEYERCFGPLMVGGGDNDGCFKWVEGPWPWEGGC